MWPSDDRFREILASARTIAIVGLSDKPERDSNDVARYLQSVGYRIVPVNPMLSEVLGEKAYPSVDAIPASIRIDVLDVFRRSEEVPPLLDQALARKIPVVWLQLGVRSPSAAENARAQGLTVVEDLCIMVTHRRLGIGRK